MKKVFKNKIINIDENIFDNKLLFEINLFDKKDKFDDIDIVFIEDLLKSYENEEMLEMSKQKPATYSNVYSPKDELKVFTEIFNNAIKNKKRTHIVWISLEEEVLILEDYYKKLWFLREDINCFAPDFSIPLISASVKIENLVWKWSDYKRMWKKIFFNPPIRESWQNKAMFKWINRWVIAWIFIWEENIEKWEIKKEIQAFLWDCIRQEKILPLSLAKTLNYNLKEASINWKKSDLIVDF